jgi:hypothetical protein
MKKYPFDWSEFHKWMKEIKSVKKCSECFRVLTFYTDDMDLCRYCVMKNYEKNLTHHKGEQNEQDRFSCTNYLA